MPFSIHPKATEAINKKAVEIISLIEENNEEISHRQILSGSFAHRPTVDWSEKLADRPMIWHNTNNERRVTIYQSYKGIKVGLNEEKYPEFLKLLNSVYKHNDISRRISFDFLYNETFNWLMETYQKKQAESEYLSFLLDKVKSVTGEYKYYFQVLNLDIAKVFKIGEVSFEYLTDTFFDKLQEQHKTEEIESLNKRFQGKVYATYILKDVEKSRGREIAFLECCKAMNVVKLHARTIVLPEHRCTFDIDRRVTSNKENEYLIQNLKSDIDLSITLFSGSTPAMFESDFIDSMVSASERFGTLISIQQPNELQQLIINSLNRFSEAISTECIHRRLVDLFTIWESLLLKNNTENIQDALIKRGGYIFRLNEEGKSEFQSFINHMYDVRSEVVHHANLKELDMKKVASLQRYTVNLMFILVGFSINYPTKVSFLEMIDSK